MNIPGYAAAAARFLKSRNVRATAPAADRELGIATIERALRARQRKRQLVLGASAVAVAAVLALSWRLAGPGAAGPRSTRSEAVSISASPAGNGAALRIGENEEPLAQPADLAANQMLETPPGGGATLRVSTGTLMQLAGNTTFRVNAHGLTQRFELRQGVLTAKVAKLIGSQRFIIETPDAEVEVRGTQFVLRVLEQGEACGLGARTRVQVTEGVVEVRTKGNVSRVLANQHWPADCDGEKTVTPATEAPTAAPPSNSAATPSTARTPAEAAASAVPAPRTLNEAPSALAQQNDLFAKGVALRRQGNTSAALGAYEELIRRYPASPLAENAMAERMRMLAAKKGAAVEARRYLARYPHGFARDEAQKLVAAP